MQPLSFIYYIYVFKKNNCIIQGRLTERQTLFCRNVLITFTPVSCPVQPAAPREQVFGFTTVVLIMEGKRCTHIILQVQRTELTILCWQVCFTSDHKGSSRFSSQTPLTSELYFRAVLSKQTLKQCFTARKKNKTQRALEWRKKMTV